MLYGVSVAVGNSAAGIPVGD